MPWSHFEVKLVSKPYNQFWFMPIKSILTPGHQIVILDIFTKTGVKLTLNLTARSPFFLTTIAVNLESTEFYRSLCKEFFATDVEGKISTKILRQKKFIDRNVLQFCGRLKNKDCLLILLPMRNRKSYPFFRQNC